MHRTSRDIPSSCYLLSMQKLDNRLQHAVLMHGDLLKLPFLYQLDLIEHWCISSLQTSTDSTLHLSTQLIRFMAKGDVLKFCKLVQLSLKYGAVSYNSHFLPYIYFRLDTSLYTNLQKSSLNEM